MAKKIKHKPSKIDARISEKARYGVDLMARKLGISVSAYIGRAIEQCLVADGIDAREPGELYSKLEKLWVPNPAERLLALCLHEPGLATPDEQVTGILLSAVKSAKNNSECIQILHEKDYVQLAGNLEKIEQDCDLVEDLIKTRPNMAKLFGQPGAFKTWLVDELKIKDAFGWREG